MDRISSYPKVLSVGHRYISDIFDGEFHCEEKVDGSQISFGVIDGELKIRSKGAEIFPEAPEKMFSIGVEVIKMLADSLLPDHIYRGEYLRAPKHNTLAYDRIPQNHIMLFDVEPSPNNFFTWEDKKNEAERLGLECVPKIDIAGVSLEAIKEALENDSILGGQKIEGVVFKNYGKITPDGKFMVGKYVSEAFKERHGKEWKAGNLSNKDVVGMLIESLKTDARYMKAIQRLRDNGMLEQSPRDIGNLIKEVQRDILDEEAEYIKDKLFEHHIKGIQRGVVGGLPEWYKDRLVEGLNIEV